MTGLRNGLSGSVTAGGMGGGGGGGGGCRCASLSSRIGCSDWNWRVYSCVIWRASSELLMTRGVISTMSSVRFLLFAVVPNRCFRNGTLLISGRPVSLYGIVVLAEIILMPWAVDSTQKH